MAQLELTTEVSEQIVALVRAQVAQEVSATTRVLLGTSANEFERLYMSGDGGALSAATFRQFLRWFEATINTRVAAIVEQKLNQSSENQQTQV